MNTAAYAWPSGWDDYLGYDYKGNGYKGSGSKGKVRSGIVRDGLFALSNQRSGNRKGGGYQQSSGYSRGTDARVGGEEEFPHVAQKLANLRDKLSYEAAQAYVALQRSLEPHTRPRGSVPQFDQDFHNHLSLNFPDARNIKARQIRAWNQWEVNVDDGPTIFCSVRLEVLSDDPAFVNELMRKARIVQETLMENSAKWKNELQPGSRLNHFDTMSRFEQECRERASTRDRGRGDGYSENARSRFMWSEHQEFCDTCDKPMKDWRVMPLEARADDASMISRRRGVAFPHHADIAPMTERCVACREFGNCESVFYEPFVLTTALKMVSGQQVQWVSFSEDVPELLIADLGPDFEHLQVCLQPHVYSAPSADEDASERPPLRGSKGRGKANRTDPFRYVDYDGCDVRYEETARYAGTRSQDGSLRERQRSVRDADFRRHMLGTSGYAPSVASSASEQQRFRPRLSPPSVGGGNRFDGGHTEFRFDKMIERLGGLSKGKFVVRLRHHLRTPKMASRFVAELSELIGNRRSEDKDTVFEDFDISQNLIPLEQFKEICSVLADPRVQVERFRAFGSPGLDDQAALLLAGWLRAVSKDMAPFEMHLSDCVIQNEGFLELTKAIVENDAFPPKDPRYVDMGPIPLYLRLEGNYIEDELIQEKIDDGTLMTMRKIDRPYYTADHKVRLLLKEDGSLGQRKGTPPAPEDAPPPKRVNDSKGKGKGKDTDKGKGKGKSKETGRSREESWRDSLKALPARSWEQERALPPRVSWEPSLRPASSPLRASWEQERDLPETSGTVSTSKPSDFLVDQAVSSNALAADSVPKVNKFKTMNKIQSSAKQLATELVMSSVSSIPDDASVEVVVEETSIQKAVDSDVRSPRGVSPQCLAERPTPFLDQLPPLRRAQFLQIVLRQVKASGGTEADKLPKAEEYLVTCGGDYDKAYRHVKSLSS